MLRKSKVSATRLEEIDGRLEQLDSAIENLALLIEHEDSVMYKDAFALKTLEKYKKEAVALRNERKDLESGS